MYRCGRSSGRSNSHSHIPHDGASSFTILFDLPNRPSSKVDDQSTYDPNANYSSSSSCSSPVDCTLSLGTASTRQSSGHKSPKRSNNIGPGCMSTNYWDVLSQPKQSPVSSRATPHADGGNDSLLARRCANCDTTSTPLWRNGPRGPKSLCNACGIRYKKEQRRAAATAPESYNPFQATPVAVAESQSRHGMSYGYSHDHPWACPAPASTSTSKSHQHSISLSSSSGRWTSTDNHNVGEEATAMPYLSWCLNLPPRAEFLHH